MDLVETEFEQFVLKTEPVLRRGLERAAKVDRASREGVVVVERWF